ncbi:MAG: T9SS type A sorting domain-containing protein [Flavobacteriales bacterium]
MIKNLYRMTILGLATVFLAGSATAQNVPIDFETIGNGASWTWTVFENTSNPALEIIDNPDQSGINTSCTVAKFTALQTGNPWAGCESQHGADLGAFMLSANTSTIKIMVWKSVISDVGVKLVTPSSAAMVEIKIPNTLTDQWELLTFDFSSYVGQGPYASEMVDQIVIFPDFDLGGRTQDNICYFDNVWGVDSVAVACSGGTAAILETERMSFELYPNPTQNNFSIRSELLIDEIIIYDLMGSIVSKEITSSNVVDVDVTNFVSGVYIIEARIGGQLIKKRLTKN